MSYMKCGICESWERCAECGWCVFCAESEKAKLLSEIERLRRVEELHNNLRTAAANLIIYLDLGGDHREVLSKLKAALEEK